MFFEAQVFEKSAPVRLSDTAAVMGDGFAKETVRKAVAAHGVKDGTVKSIRFADTLPADAAVTGEEAYAVIITETEAVLYGESERARIYAAITLKQMCECGETCVCRLEDAPDCALRGYRVYLPGRNSFDEFLTMIDTIVYYKYNCVFFEIGGAMEYKRHPEINEAWAAFAADTHRYSGRAHEIQNGYDWQKNSIHTDNGEGDILTQDEVRMLIDYCRTRGLDVYPEVPTLSHSDYICLAHPELREREEDPYPDTYCPNHPDVYKLVFDIMDEVIEVFQPKMINIGHDEFYTMCLCPRCKDTRPDDIFAADVTRIHAFLTGRGIRTAMWGEKLLPVVTQNGSTFGGSEAYRHPRWKYPAVYTCQSKLPKDILMIHWYYSFGMQYDFVYHTHGYEAVYGNMNADNVQYWRDRRRYGIKGGICSNWGSNHPEHMQRNGQYFRLIFGAYALWSKTYDNNRQGAVMKKTFEEAFRLHYGDAADGFIRITHTTDKNIPYKSFYDGVFIENDVYHMGNYRVTYADGTTSLLDVKYGTNIANSAIPYEVNDNDDTFDPTTLNSASGALVEISYSTVPHTESGKTWYTTAYRNPQPEKKIESVKYVPDTDAKVETLRVEY